MTSPQRLHLRIQEICGKHEFVSVTDMMQEFAASREAIIHSVDHLVHLGILKYLGPDKDKVVVTEWGKRWNVPN